MAFVKGVDNRNFLPARHVRPSVARPPIASFFPLHFRQTEMVMSFAN